MTTNGLLAALQLACFQLCAWPAMWRIVTRHSSRDLSVWREWIILLGVAAQFSLMVRTGTPWLVRLSPIASAGNVMLLLWMIRRYRE